MPEFPQLPVHVQRWLSELADLTLEEHGAYFLTVMHMWLQPDSGMPVDPEWMRKKLHVHATKWRRLWPVIRSFMTEIDGRLYQKTLGSERQYLRDNRAKARTNANKRWDTFRANREKNSGKTSVKVVEKSGKTSTKLRVLPDIISANLLKNNNVGDASQHEISHAPTPTPNKKERKKEEVRKKKEATNGNLFGGKRKPRHRQTSKQGRVWLDVGTSEFADYERDYREKHHVPVPLFWHESGAWFNLLGEAR